MLAKLDTKIHYSRRLFQSFVIVFLSFLAVSINIFAVCCLSCLGTWILAASTLCFCTFNHLLLLDPEIIYDRKRRKNLNLVYFIAPLVFLSGYFVHQIEDFGFMNSLIYSALQTAFVLGLLAIYHWLLRTKILAPFIEVSIPVIS